MGKAHDVAALLAGDVNCRARPATRLPVAASGPNALFRRRDGARCRRATVNRSRGRPTNVLNRCPPSRGHRCSPTGVGPVIVRRGTPHPKVVHGFVRPTAGVHTPRALVRHERHERRDRPCGTYFDARGGRRGASAQRRRSSTRHGESASSRISGSPVSRTTPCAAAVATAKQSPSARPWSRCSHSGHPGEPANGAPRARSPHRATRCRPRRPGAGSRDHGGPWDDDP